ncbi:hypothetical protein [Iodobacter fluviatilis]|uniref:Uncharacterized protein n=1 Tax=Iodobacter fluviatilis TaxID=537 RepID=A0A377Q884_9NEIS|nr:hypothetical protein [Iodobacter fluviatilis]TCU84596.1 hypothetical protein EV682_109121 [Iodobacter fluviatilis]STQ90061.1 Uncharacterised protein [Iodobacter fluviatilis]
MNPVLTQIIQLALVFIFAIIFTGVAAGLALSWNSRRLKRNDDNQKIKPS